MKKIAHEKNFVHPRPEDTHIAYEAWDYFIRTGEFPEKSPRAVITRSWLRSVELGINPNAERADMVLSLEEIEERLRREELGMAGVPVMKKLLQKFDGSKHVLVLADHNGCILHSIGHRQVQKGLDKINFMPGAQWSEDHVGPNGIGTPLALHQPEVVMGHEHYCKGWQPWVCYGAPVFDANGKKVVGIIDITAPVEKAIQETMLLTISVAQSVQYGLNVIDMYRREHLRMLSKDIINRWCDSAVLLIDQGGYVIDYNNKIARFFRSETGPVMGRPLLELIPGVWDAVHTRIQTNSYSEINVDIVGEFGVNRPIQINIEPVSHGHECIGAVLVFNSNSHSRPGLQIGKPSDKIRFPDISQWNDQRILSSNENLKSINDDLIRKVLAQTGGNISRAAKILGINRTTIYRRLKKSK